MFNVYVLKNQEGLLYIGQTNNMEDRLRRHNADFSISTKNKGPWKLVYKEEFATRAEAMKREKNLKSFAGREWVRNQGWWRNV